MRTEAEIIEAWWAAQLAGKPKSIMSMIVEEVIEGALVTIKPEIDALVEQALIERAQRQ